MMGYDAIVKELSETRPAGAPGTSRSRYQRPSVGEDPFDSIWMHGGIGFATSIQTLGLPNGDKAYLNQRGMQASLGIDLFSESWMAEGTVRSFGESEDAAAQVALKEFELKVLYKSRLSQQLGFRAGGGLNARYMTVKDSSGLVGDYTTPSSVATLGLDLYLSRAFSFGLDVSARNTMIAETIDQNSFDATIRADTHF